MSPWRKPLRLGLAYPLATGHAEQMSFSRGEEHGPCFSHTCTGARIGSECIRKVFLDRTTIEAEENRYLRGSMVLGCRSEFDVMASKGASELVLMLPCALYNPPGLKIVRAKIVFVSWLSNMSLAFVVSNTAATVVFIYFNTDRKAAGAE